MPPLDQKGFHALIERLAESWRRCDSESGAACFTDDAVYMEPPDRQLFVGRDELLAFFGALTEGTIMDLHNVWFDADNQVGAVEYTFGHRDWPSAVHGVAVAQLRDGAICFWREYQRRGARDFTTFLERESKQWRSTVEEYS